MGRIVIVSASLGAGHDGAARALARRLRADGHAVTCHDFLDLLPGRLGAAVKATYRRQVSVAPGSWEWLLTRLELHPWFRAFVVFLAAGSARRLRRIVRSGPAADAVLCTYPLAGQVAARLRARGRITARVLLYPTDPAVHPLWIAAGADLYLAAHAGIAEQVRALGGRRVVVVAPAVRPEFRPAGPGERAATRARFGLPPDGPLALVMSGSWGVGDVAASAWDVARSGVATPVVVCGENTALRRDLHDLPGVVFGWVADLPELMRACDVVVLNSGGTSLFEAHAAGLPVVHYRCLAGHSHSNAEVSAAIGLARWARDPAGLAEELRHGTRVPPEPGRAPCPAVAVHALLDDPAPGPAHRRRRARRLVTVAAAVVALFWMATGGASFAVGHGLDALSTGHLPPGHVYLVVEAPADGVVDPAAVRELTGLHAAVAVSTRTAAAQPAMVGRLAAAGLELVNSAGGPPYATGWIEGRGAIGADATTLGRLTAHRPRWLLSSGDLDAVDVSTAVHYGERFVIPSTVIDCGGPAVLPTRGGIVLLRQGSHGCDLDTALRSLAAGLAGRGLHPTSFTGVSA